jgi:hypothetical protein
VRRPGWRGDGSPHGVLGVPVLLALGVEHLHAADCMAGRQRARPSGHSRVPAQPGVLPLTTDQRRTSTTSVRH